MDDRQSRRGERRSLTRLPRALFQNVNSPHRTLNSHNPLGTSQDIPIQSTHISQNASSLVHNVTQTPDHNNLNDFISPIDSVSPQDAIPNQIPITQTLNTEHIQTPINHTPTMLDIKADFR